MSRSSPKMYFTGVLCCRGHLAPRYIKGNGCQECLREYDFKRRGIMSITRQNFRKDALARGSKVYLGLDCTSNHGGLRRTSSGDCLICEKNKSRLKYQKSHPIKPHECEICNEMFLPRRNSDQNKFCSAACKRINRHQLYAAGHFRRKSITHLGFEKCRFCGIEFQKRSKNHFYCSQKHKNKCAIKSDASLKRQNLRRLKGAVALRALEELGIKVEL